MVDDPDTKDDPDAPIHNHGRDHNAVGVDAAYGVLVKHVPHLLNHNNRLHTNPLAVQILESVADHKLYKAPNH